MYWHLFVEYQSTTTLELKHLIRTETVRLHVAASRGVEDDIRHSINGQHNVGRGITGNSIYMTPTDFTCYCLLLHSLLEELELPHMWVYPRSEGRAGGYGDWLVLRFFHPQIVID
eukprot:gnl/Dysnectes_brevis/5959_a8902_463.p2 GENE.gnl/Dysnectes_brevis/5959_a8902_463~~gnl/Dysnectes_brevis/5959_a8902_463.p2  ORF type:complete len:115 (+),score=6.47 gnl/Dysnectes_brevis/5959_a8902_463:124-468(+)